ncbi:MAG: YezD family protein [Lachnospiraceae bacterium]|nr:YezD family protein [Lachnospiraceae bacterium]
MPNSEEIKKESYLNIINNLVKDMKYGMITVIVQDGKVIQIDKTDKIRLKS